MSDFSFHSAERLKHRKLIEQAFKAGKVVKAYPLILIYQAVELPEDVPFQILFSVPKKRFKKAVDRNLLKRRMREAWRLNRKDFLTDLPAETEQHALLLIYTGKDIASFDRIQQKIITLLTRLKQEGLTSDSTRIPPEE